jgi:hypothetical protein
MSRSPVGLARLTNNFNLLGGTLLGHEAFQPLRFWIAAVVVGLILLPFNLGLSPATLC